MMQIAFAAVRLRRWMVLLFMVSIAGCSMGYHPESPDVRYSTQSSEAARLQVPPDLTDVSEGEQFILPGTTAAPVTRDTLLPQFESATYQRNAEQSWLQVVASAEKVWPQLISFLRSERLPIGRTEPATGLIVTQWQQGAAAGSEENSAYRRVAFRLERAGNGTRVFARSQQASKAVATQPGADAAVWPANSSHPEQTNLILQRLLVFVGLEEQKAKGLLTEQAALNVLNNATLEVDAGRSRLLLHQGYQPSIRALSTTLTALGFDVGQTSGGGTIRIVDTASVVGAAAVAYTIRVEPVHVSAVKVSVLDAAGNPAQVQDARKLLGILQTRLVRSGTV